MLLTPLSSAPGSCANVPDAACSDESDAAADFGAPAAGTAPGLVPFEGVVDVDAPSPLAAVSYARVAIAGLPAIDELHVHDDPIWRGA
jgi:hypothetical protein